MRITKVSIKNIMALDELEIKPGKVETVVEGANAVGKTSVLNAIRAALGSGHDATLIRKGEKEAEVVIVLEDGTEITKRITETKSDTKVKLQEAGRVSTPMRYIESLLDGFSLNPIEFLTVPPKRRADLLLESLPLSVTVKQINDCLPRTFHISEIDKHPLDVITEMRREIYDERTGTNRIAKTATAAVDEAKKALPNDPEGGDWDTLLQAATGATASFDEATDAEIERVNHRFEERLAVVLADTNQQIHDAIEVRGQEVGRLNGEIEKLEAQLTDLKAQRAKVENAETVRRLVIAQERNSSLEQLSGEQEKVIKAYEATRSDQRELLQGEVADIRSKRDAHIRAQSLRDLIKQREKEAATNEKASEILSTSLDKLDALKASLLDALPIKGVEVRNGEVFVLEDSIKDYVPFDRANDARKIRIAIEVAKVRARTSKVPLIIADGMERLDSKQFALFEKELVQAKKEGFQVIVARVTDQQKLTVRSVK